MTYHVMLSGYSALTPIGATAGGLLYTIGLWRRYPSVFASMGSASLLAGGIGIMIGLNGMSSTARRGEKASPPWNDDGIQTRVDGLSNNFNVRVIDVSCWGCMALSGLA